MKFRFHTVFIAFCAAVFCLLPGQSRAQNIIGPQTAVINPGEYDRILYVSKNTGSDVSGDGSSGNPWETISHALSQITDAAPSKIYAVLVAQGTYSGSTIIMKEYVDMFGGFDASSWNRDIYDYPSVLDGQEARRVLVGCDNAVLDGFTIKRGKMRGKGAGILCDNVSPTITNNIFTENLTLQPEDWSPSQWHEIANDGSSIACLNGAAPIILNNIFANNNTETGRGGGVACHAGSSPIIANNVFTNNVTGLIDPMRSSDGGAISCSGYSHAHIVNNIISDNRADAGNDGGGIFCEHWSSALISGNIIVGNICGDDGGGIFVGGRKHYTPEPTPADYLVTIERNVIMGNEAHESASGGMRITNYAQSKVINNIICQNWEGIMLRTGWMLSMNNTICDNDNEGVILDNEEGSIPVSVVTNTITYGNGAQQIDVDDHDSGWPAVSFCNVERGYTSPGTSNNINANPRFVDDGFDVVADTVTYHSGRFLTSIYVGAADLQPNELANRVIRRGAQWGVIHSNDEDTIAIWGDLREGSTTCTILPSYHLGSGSPCVGRGTDDDAPESDVDRQLRGSEVDIGADEYYFLPTDLYQDGIINLLDLGVLAGYWMQDKPSVDIAPAGGDGVVDFLDLEKLSQQWLQAEQ